MLIFDSWSLSAKGMQEPPGKIFHESGWQLGQKQCGINWKFLL